MSDRCTPTAYHFEADGIKASIDWFDDGYWRVYFSRITTADTDRTKYIEDMKWQTAENAANGIERMIHEREPTEFHSVKAKLAELERLFDGNDFTHGGYRYTCDAV